MVSPMSLIKTRVWEYLGTPCKILEIDEAYNSQTKSYRKYLRIENLKTGKIDELPLEALNNSRELNKQRLEQISRSEQEQPIPQSSGRGQKPKHQRGAVKADYSINNPVKRLNLTRYPIHPEH